MQGSETFAMSKCKSGFNGSHLIYIYEQEYLPPWEYWEKVREERQEIIDKNRRIEAEKERHERFLENQRKYGIPQKKKKKR